MAKGGERRRRANTSGESVIAPPAAVTLDQVRCAEFRLSEVARC